jgi:hypothetical protein
VADSQLEQQQHLEPETGAAQVADVAREQQELPVGSRVSEGRVRQRWRRVGILLAAGVVLVAAGGFAWWRLAERTIEMEPRANLPEVLVNRDGILVLSPTGVLVANIGRFRDELTAYLYYGYLRSRPQKAGTELLMGTYSLEGGQDAEYALFVLLPNDLEEGVQQVGELVRAGYIGEFDLLFPAMVQLQQLRDQTRVFEAAYNLPVRDRLEEMGHARLLPSLASFIRFKSQTDPRIRLRMEPTPPPLSRANARQLADDILAVTEFYGLPLEFFLGIGAMENNYMSVRGDLEHAVWKPREQPGDLVIARRGRRVRVLNFSIGVWQITRETLRRTHNYYLRDLRERDYTLLPEHLRPPEKLDLDNVPEPVLTTYAGLLFRRLLDHFEGDVALAAGAYNGGVRNPNARYAGGVTLVAGYARRILEQAAVLGGQPVADIPALRPRR